MNEDKAVSSSRPLEDPGREDVEGQENVQVKPGVFDTREKKLTLFCISLYWFIICCAYAMIAPFFPGEVSSLEDFRKFLCTCLQSCRNKNSSNHG